MITQRLSKIKTDDNQRIALWEVMDKDKTVNYDILLIHGTFSDKRVFTGLSRYLAQSGARCWVMEWRSHGDSSVSDTLFNFETVADFDLPAIFDYLLGTERIPQLHVVTHSGGGICLTMYLIKHQHNIKKIQSISMLACQSFGAAKKIRQWLMLWSAKVICRVLGFVPGKFIGSCNESYYTMRQWFDWNLARKFISKDGTDFVSKMEVVDVPILSISAEKDWFIAPRQGCEEYISAYKNPKNKFIHYSIKQGHLENYTHGSIAFSKNAAKEVWPQIQAWITSNNKI